MSNYTQSVWKVSKLSNAVPGFAMPGAFIPGMPPQLILANDPVTSERSPAWHNRFGNLSKYSVLYDYQITFAGNYITAGDLAFGAGTTGSSLSEPTTRDTVDPSPTWQNQFQHLSKSAVLYDYYLQIAGVSSGSVAFGANTTGVPVIFAAGNIDIAVPGQAFLNQFRGAKGKHSVLWDIKPTSYTQNYGQFCFTGSTESDANLYGGTAALASMDATDGGTATDTNAYGGTAVDAHAGYGGTEANDTYGGTATEANTYGGMLVGGCYV